MPKILIADDEEDILKILAARIKAAGYEVVIAVDGEAALQAALREKPDLLILDAIMPTLNGWRVCQKLKLNPAFRSVPIILLSALINKDAPSEKGLDPGDYMMSKPYDPDQLLLKVRELLDSRKPPAA